MVAAGWSPSVRLFEAGACGTPIVSDEWDGIDALFEPGREIILARDTRRVIDALAGDAVAIGAAARRRVLAAHSADHRAAELETLINTAIASQRRHLMAAVSRHRQPPLAETSALCMAPRT